MENADRAERKKGHDDESSVDVGAMLRDHTAVERTVREAVEAFERALRSGNSIVALALLHPDVRIYESGHAETKEEYRRGHLKADMSFLHAVTIETTWDEVLAGDRMALYLSQYHAKGTFRERYVDSHGTETIVLVPTDDGWRIRHIHWSSR